MIAHGTYLAPGQRYVRADLAAWRADHQITIVHVGRGKNDQLRVTYVCPSGREVSGSADQFQLAVAAGEIVPVIGAGQVADC